MKVYDFVIVGSGAAGSVMAYYLAREGASVLLLEAGKQYDAASFPDDEIHANAQMYWNGGMDPNDDASLVFLRGKALGGGTVVNQALLDRFDDVVFDEWRGHTGVPFFSEVEMDRHYTEIEQHLHLHTIERSEWNRNAELYVEMFEKQGYGWAKLRRGQRDCAVDKGNDCITCLGGCRRDSKQSMLVTFLPKALQQGLQIKTEFVAQQVVHGRNLVTVYGKERGQATAVYGRKCIVASGALGTTELLLRSGFKDRLPLLGEGLHSHPQWMNIAFFEEPVDAHKGSLQAVKSDDERFRRQGFKLENVFAGPIAISMLNNVHGEALQRFMAKYRYMASLEVCIRDASSGRVYLDRTGRMRVDKPLREEDVKRGMAGIEVVNALYYSIGATEVLNSPFNFSLHVQGGCAIGQAAANSVVNEQFQVHGYDNLYISDISTFARPPGMNPSLTVMAQSHRASEQILAEFGVRQGPVSTSGVASQTIQQPSSAKELV